MDQTIWTEKVVSLFNLSKTNMQNLNYMRVTIENQTLKIVEQYIRIPGTQHQTRERQADCRDYYQTSRPDLDSF